LFYDHPDVDLVARFTDEQSDVDVDLRVESAAIDILRRINDPGLTRISHRKCALRPLISVRNHHCGSELRMAQLNLGKLGKRSGTGANFDLDVLLRARSGQNWAVPSR
jgi:hypothetical protein